MCDAVGDDEHADRIVGLVDLGAQPPAAVQRRIGAVVVGVHPHLGARLRVDLVRAPSP